MNKKRLQKLAGILQEQHVSPNPFSRSVGTTDPWGIVTDAMTDKIANAIVASYVGFYYDELGSEWSNSREFLAKSMGENWDGFDEQWSMFAEYLHSLVRPKVIEKLPQQLKRERRIDVAHKRRQRD